MTYYYKAACKPCRVVEAVDYQRANPEKKAVWTKNDRTRNRDKRNARTREYRKENRDKVNRWARETYRNAPGTAETRARRRARMLEADTRTITNKDRARLLASPCAACGSRDLIEIDHVIPLARGGRHSVGNMQALCQSCNRSKRDKLWIEYKALQAA